jgi:hypothetical protein
MPCMYVCTGYQQVVWSVTAVSYDVEVYIRRRCSIQSTRIPHDHKTVTMKTCDAVHFGRYVPTFPSPSKAEVTESCDFCYFSTKVHGLVTRKTVITN